MTAKTFTLLLAALQLMVLHCSSVKAVPFTPESKCVYLKSVLYDEYLYTEAPKGAYEEYPNINRVFAWGRKADDPSNWEKTKGNEFKYQAVYHIQKNNTTCQECFTIKSAYFKDAGSLFSFAERGPERFVATFSGKNQLPTDLGQDIWEIMNVPGNPNHIRIKNKDPLEKKIEYVYAGTQKPDDDRRAVYMYSEKENSKIDTWKGAADWVMLDVECPSYVL